MALKIFATVAYGILVFVGGILGYQQAKSKPSLIAGVVSGSLLLAAAFLQIQNIAAGLILAKVVTLLLLVVFTTRLIKTRKFWPAGLMVVTGTAALIFMFS